MITDYVLEAITTYPIKGACGIPLQTAFVGQAGILGDRQYTVAELNPAWDGDLNPDVTSMFVTQRSSGSLGVACRSMLHVKPQIQGDTFVVHAQDMEYLVVPYMEDLALPWELIPVQIWNDQVDAVHMGHAAATWFTRYLSRERHGNYVLTRMPTATSRTTKGSGYVGFADSFPISIHGLASLNEVSIEADVSIPGFNFRSNLVFSGGYAFDEDAFGLIRIGERCVLRFGKLCKRCVMTTYHFETGAAGAEPLKSLAAIRRGKGGVFFSTLMDVVLPGDIKVGDPIKVLKWR